MWWASWEIGQNNKRDYLTIAWLEKRLVGISLSKKK